MEYYDLYQHMKGEEDPAMPPPLKYNFLDYLDQVSNNSPLNGTDDGSSTWGLTRITMDDLKQKSQEDVAADLIKNGDKNKLGAPLDDEGLSHYTGIPQQ